MVEKCIRGTLILFFPGILMMNGCRINGEHPKEERPNILLVITDDQGYGDAGYHGNPYIRTPVLDSLAGLATRIDPFYVSPVCAPTRASLMTGRYHLRTGVYDTYNGGAMMATGEVTLAEVLSENGYHTAMIGKWHLGDSYPLRPMDQGFDYCLAHKGGGIGQPGDDFGNFIRPDSSYFDPYLWENGTRVRRSGYCSDIFTDQAIALIREHQERSNRPFFIYLAYNAPHTPLQLPGSYMQEYENLEFDAADFENSGSNVHEMTEKDLLDARRVYGMVSNIDDNLGRLVSVLEELDLMEQTLVVFLTDNGPQQRRYTAGFSGRKGSVLEGGIRVPCFFHWQGTLEQNRVITFPSAHIDIMPTLLELAGIPYRGDMDGTSLVPLLKGERTSLEQRPLFFVWARGYPQKYTNMAVREGPYKLVGFTEHGISADSLRLHYLPDDPSELKESGIDHPEIKHQLTQQLDGWYGEMLSSPNLLDPPRIVIGSEQENPVILGRNDWKSPKAKQWASPDAFGYWDVEIRHRGPYDVKLVYRDPLTGEGKAYVRAGIRQYWVTHRDTTMHELTIQGVTFDPGKQMFEGWVESKGRIHTPAYIEVTKQ